MSQSSPLLLEEGFGGFTVWESSLGEQKELRDPPVPTLTPVHGQDLKVTPQGERQGPDWTPRVLIPRLVPEHLSTSLLSIKDL